MSRGQARKHRGTVKPPLIEAKAILEHAERYHAGSLCLLEAIRNPKTRDLRLVAPAVTLESFALELLLKCLLVLEKGVNPGGHDLLQLFNALSLSSKQRLERRFDQFLRQCELQAATGNADLKGKLAAAVGKTSINSLKDALEAGSKTFDFMRYVFDYDDSFGFMLSPIGLELHSMILDKQPQWASDPPTMTTVYVGS